MSMNISITARKTPHNIRAIKSFECWQTSTEESRIILDSTDVILAYKIFVMLSDNSISQKSKHIRDLVGWIKEVKPMWITISDGVRCVHINSIDLFSKELLAK